MYYIYAIYVYIYVLDYKLNEVRKKEEEEDIVFLDINVTNKERYTALNNNNYSN